MKTGGFKFVPSFFENSNISVNLHRSAPIPWHAAVVSALDLISIVSCPITEHVFV